jgi:hypothetical protein
MIRQCLPPNEEETKNQNNRQKSKRQSNPLADRKSPKAIVQPM